MTDIPFCQGPDPKPHRPAFKAPAGACDTHAHIFPAAHRERYSPARGYTPPDASLESFLELHSVLGIDRAVLTQPSVYGTDNTAILEAVEAYPERMRAVAAVGNDVTEAELERLNEAGVKGVRVNIVDKGGMPFDDIADVVAFTHRIRDFGWHLELLLHAQDFPDLRQDFKSSAVDIVVGHLGYMTTSHGIEHPGFNELVAMVNDGRCWAKLTGSYRITTAASTPYPDVVPFAQKLIAANPDRVVWGSDWPHPTFSGAMPNDGYLFDQLGVWTDNDQDLIERILVTNPQVLYEF